MAARIEVTYAQYVHFLMMADRVRDELTALDDPNLKMAIEEDDSGTLRILTQPLFPAGDGDIEATETYAVMDRFSNVTMVSI